MNTRTSHDIGVLKEKKIGTPSMGTPSYNEYNPPQKYSGTNTPNRYNDKLMKKPHQAGLPPIDQRHLRRGGEQIIHSYRGKENPVTYSRQDYAESRQSYERPPRMPQNQHYSK